jgi:hypothetical protein
LFCSQQVRRDKTHAEQKAEEQEKHTYLFVHWTCFVKGGGLSTSQVPLSY